MAGARWGALQFSGHVATGFGNVSRTHNEISYSYVTTFTNGTKSMPALESGEIFLC
jgi:hypothetical protein